MSRIQPNKGQWLEPGEVLSQWPPSPHGGAGQKIKGGALTPHPEGSRLWPASWQLPPSSPKAELSERRCRTPLPHPAPGQGQA